MLTKMENFKPGSSVFPDSSSAGIHSSACWAFEVPMTFGRGNCGPTSRAVALILGPGRCWKNSPAPPRFAAYHMLATGGADPQVTKLSITPNVVIATRGLDPRGSNLGATVPTPVEIASSPAANRNDSF
jgi:hypothetical protein